MPRNLASSSAGLYIAVCSRSLSLSSSSATASSMSCNSYCKWFSPAVIVAYCVQAQRSAPRDVILYLAFSQYLNLFSYLNAAFKMQLQIASKFRRMMRITMPAVAKPPRYLVLQSVLSEKTMRIMQVSRSMNTALANQILFSILPSKGLVHAMQVAKPKVSNRNTPDLTNPRVPNKRKQRTVLQSIDSTGRKNA